VRRLPDNKSILVALIIAQVSAYGFAAWMLYMLATGQVHL